MCCRIGISGRGNDRNFIDFLERVDALASLTIADKFIVGTDVDYIAAAAPVLEEAENCLGQWRACSAVGCKLSNELRPVVNCDCFMKPCSGVRSLAQEGRSAGADSLDRSWSCRNLLYIDTRS